jgi:membrane dipeptidase
MRFQEYLGGSTLMQRRDFLKAGAAGMTLALAEGQSQAQVELRTDVKGADAKDTPEDLSVVVIGTDGSIPAKTVTDRYVAAHADVWHYLPQGARFSQVLEYLDSDPRIKQAKSVADILANKQAGKVSMVVGWQDTVALEEENGNEWRKSRPPRTKLREYYELGLRTANLTYQLSNQFGGGLLDPEARLTAQGKHIIGKMQELGILVDVCGHTGDQTALDVIAMARRPVAITHGCCRGLNDNPRNSPDKVIEGVARTGGVMGVAAIDCFMTWSRKDASFVDTGPYPPRANVARYVDEFDYLKRLVGIDHIAIGTDFISDLEPADPSQLFEIPPEMGYNQTPTLKFIEGFESVSDIGNVRAEMEKRGYTEEEIAKVFGGNWMRVFRQAWNS